MSSLPPLTPAEGMENIPVNVTSFLLATKDILETLTGQTSNTQAEAVLRGDINFTLPAMNLQAIAATGQSAANGAASASDVAQLVSDVRALHADVKQLYDVFSILDRQLRGA